MRRDLRREMAKRPAASVRPSHQIDDQLKWKILGKALYFPKAKSIEVIDSPEQIVDLFHVSILKSTAANERFGFHRFCAIEWLVGESCFVAEFSLLHLNKSGLFTTVNSPIN